MNNSNIQQPFNRKWNLFGGIAINTNDNQKKKKRKPVCTCHLAYQNIHPPPLPASLPAELNNPMTNQQMTIYDNDTNRSMLTMDSTIGYNYNNSHILNNEQQYLANQYQPQSTSLIKDTIHSNMGPGTPQHRDYNRMMSQNHLEQTYLIEHQQANFNHRNNTDVGPYLENNLLNDPNIQYNIYHQQNNVITYSPDMNIYRRKRLQKQLIEADNNNLSWPDAYRFRSNSVPNDSTQYDYFVQQQRPPIPGLSASQQQHWPSSRDFPCQCNQCCIMATAGSPSIQKNNFERKTILNYDYGAKYGSSTSSMAIPSAPAAAPSKPRVSFGPLMTYPIMDDPENSYKQHLENLRKKEEKKTSSKLTTELLPLDTQISQMMGDSALICRIL